MDMIQTDKLVFEYDKRDEDGNIIGKSRAIDEVDIDVKEGQFIAILGHNGSGKSTFAKHINALLVPTDGTMWVDGRDTKDPNELWNVRQSAGMVFQNPDNQIIGTVVEEDVGFGPENLGVPTDEIWKREALFMLVIAYLIILLPISLICSFVERRVRYAEYGD